jgi:quercetin dioxygenase-like cupin family protein
VAPARHSAEVPIEFLDLLASGDDDGWVPLTPDPAATIDGDAWRSTSIDADFGLDGVRLAAGTVVERHRHNCDLLLLVFDGDLTVRFVESSPDGAGSDERDAVVRAGAFARIDAGTEHSLLAGGDGATFLSSWPNDPPPIETLWSTDPADPDRNDVEADGG